MVKRDVDEVPLSTCFVGKTYTYAAPAFESLSITTPTKRTYV